MTEADVEFIKFDTATTSFDCGSRVDIGPIVNMPAGPCGGFPAMTDVADGTKRAKFIVDIDVSSRAAGTPTALVTYSTAGSGSCSNEQELRIYRSTNGGSSWAWELVTGCQDSVHPAVRYARTDEGGSIANRVHLLTMHESGSSGGGRTGLRPVQWRSTNNGVDWVGTFIGSTQTTFPTVTGTSACYWGDYDALVPDIANNTMYYAWGDGDDADWRIHGQGRNP